MIILITGWFIKYDILGNKSSEKEFMVSHGYDTKTDQLVILPYERLEYFTDRKWNEEMREWVIYDKDEL